MTTDRLAEILDAVAAEIADRVGPQLRLAAPAAVPTEPREEPLVLDYRQTGARLGGMSQTSVRQLWASGELPSVVIGGRRYTRTADLQAYVADLTPSLPGQERTPLAVVREAA